MMLKNKIWLGIILSIILLVSGICGYAYDYTYTQQSGSGFFVASPDKADAHEDTNEVRQIINDLGTLLGHSKMDGDYPKDLTTGGTLAIPDSRLVSFATGAKGDLWYCSSTNVWTKLNIGADNKILVVNVDVPNWEIASSALLSDVAFIAMLDETETITENWVNIAFPWADNEVADDITCTRYYLKTEINTQAKAEGIWEVSLVNDGDIDTQEKIETIWEVTLSTDAERNALTYSDVGAEQADAGLTSLAGLAYVSPSFIKVIATDTYAIRTIAEVKQDLDIVKSVTLVIAANDSSAKGKSMADYVCDGTADNVEIQAAIDALSIGGSICLLEGKFYLENQIEINNKASIWIYGQGRSTIISMENAIGVSGAISIANSCQYIKISDLWIDNYGKHDTYDTEVIKAQDSDYITIERVSISNPSGYVSGYYRTSIRMQECSNVWLIDCDIKNSFGYGFRIHSTTTATSSNIFVRGCYFENDHWNSIALYEIKNFSVVQNIVIEAGHAGIAISPGKDGIIAGNIIKDVTSSGEGGIEIENGHETEGEQQTYNISVIGNVVINCHYGIYTRKNGTPRDAPHDIIISNNVIRECTFGIYLMQGNNVIVEGNTVMKTADQGIIISDDYNIIKGNIVTECDYRGMVITSNYNTISGNFVIDNGNAELSNQVGIYISSTGSYNAIIENRSGDSRVEGKTQQYGLYFGSSTTNNVYRDNDFTGVAAGGASVLDSGTDNNLLSYNRYSDHFQDCVVASTTYVHAAITGTGAEQEITTDITNPDVPRNISITNSANSTGDVTIEGIDAKGNSVSEDITIVTGGTAYGNKAFATVSKIIIPATVVNPDTISVGISDKLGLSNIVYENGDVYKVKVNNADATGQFNMASDVDTTNDTVDMSSLTTGEITAGDDITIWYGSNLNIID